MAAPRYDLTDLRLFMHIAEAGNLTRGAERGRLSLAAASLRIKNLEESLGTQLLRRQSHGVELTNAGQTLLTHAASVFRALERMHGDIQPFSSGLKGRIRLFANTTAVTEFLPAALGAYLAAHPHVDIDLEEHLSADIARAVADGLVDIGILAGSVQTGGLDLLPYRRDRLALAAPRRHWLAGRNSISFGDILEENFVSLHSASVISAFAEQVAREAGSTLAMRIRVASFEGMCRMIEAGVGIGMLPGAVARRLSRSHDIAVVELDDAWAERELKVCVRSREDLPVFARDLVDFLVMDDRQAEGKLRN